MNPNEEVHTMNKLGVAYAGVALLANIALAMLMMIV